MRMKIYKYARLGDDWVTERGGRRGSVGGKGGRVKERRDGGRGGKGLTEVDCPVCFCCVLRDPVACVCVSVFVSWCVFFFV